MGHKHFDTTYEHYVFAQSQGLQTAMDTFDIRNHPQFGTVNTMVNTKAEIIDLAEVAN
jgi:hypothetical protein